MKHPHSRSERRHNGEVWRNRQRFKMLNTWWTSRYESQDWTTNNMWWGRKQTSAHGNRCMCSYEKTSRKEVRKRREGLDVKANRKSLHVYSLPQDSQADQQEAVDQVILFSDR